MTETLDRTAELRKPFDPGQVGKLPRITCGACRDTKAKVCDQHRKSQCPDCGNWITGAHMHLDYVGHAAVTDRLLAVDPAWTWEPLALDAAGLPAVDRNGGLWIRLTVAGVTRLGYGDAQGKTGGDAVKEIIGDALRNAAMRFGVALDLWHKGDLAPGNHDTPAPAPGDPEMVAAVLAEAAAAGATEDTARAHARDQLAGVELEDLDRDQLRAEWTHWHGIAAQASAAPPSQTDPAAASAATAPVGDAQRPAQPHEPEPAPITRGQSAKLHALLNAGRVADRAAKLRVVSALAGRELTSTSQLIKDEAVTVIDTLEAILTGPDPAATLAGMAIDDTHDQDQEAQAQ